VLPEPARGRELAHTMIATAKAAGLPLTALLTDMSEPLARSAGNALEVLEAVAMLRGATSDPRLLEVTLALGAEVLVQGGIAKDAKAARAVLARSITSGTAAERFARMVASLGGPADFLERPGAYLASAPVVIDVPAPRDGIVSGIDTRAIGFAVVTLGGGRTAPERAVNPAVGFDRLLPVGTRVRGGDSLARVHAAGADAAQAAAATVKAAFSIGERAPDAPPLVERID
jgi:thymidine phosphorylase